MCVVMKMFSMDVCGVPVLVCFVQRRRMLKCVSEKICAMNDTERERDRGGWRRLGSESLLACPRLRPLVYIHIGTCIFVGSVENPCMLTFVCVCPGQS